MRGKTFFFTSLAIFGGIMVWRWLGPIVMNALRPVLYPTTPTAANNAGGQDTGDLV